jgi:hypothetical protein
MVRAAARCRAQHQRAMAEPVGEQTEQRRRKNGREKHPAVGHPGLLQRESLGMLKIFDRVGLPERKEHGGIQHVHVRGCTNTTGRTSADRARRCARVCGPAAARARPVTAVESNSSPARRAAQHGKCPCRATAAPASRARTANAPRRARCFRRRNRRGRDSNTARSRARCRCARTIARARPPSEMKIAPSLTPKMKRPATMSSYGLPIAVSAAPSTPIAATHSVTRAGPNRSMSKPLISASATFGQADDPVEHADLRLAEAALALQQIGDRTDDVGLVVAAGDRDRREREHPPAHRRDAACA